MFLESFMLWNGNSSPKNIGLTIVGYLYKRGIEKNDMGYACAVGMVLLVIALAINVVQLVATGTFKKYEKLYGKNRCAKNNGIKSSAEDFG